MEGGQEVGGGRGRKGELLSNEFYVKANVSLLCHLQMNKNLLSFYFQVDNFSWV